MKYYHFSFLLFREILLASSQLLRRFKLMLNCFCTFSGEYIYICLLFSIFSCNRFLNIYRSDLCRSESTIAGWVRETISETGINTGKHTTHSCRCASTSAVGLAGIELCTVAKVAGWCGKSTFYNYYKKDIMCTRKNKKF